MKFFITLLFFTTLIFANDKLIIDADSFESDDSKGITIFTGNVKLKMGKDKLNAYKLEIFMEANKKAKSNTPFKYVASGNADFEIYSNGKVYKGKGNRVIYSPKKQEYTIIGNGYVKEEIEQRELFGETIFINQLTGNAKVKGTQNKPVRFIINVNNNDKNKEEKK